MLAARILLTIAVASSLSVLGSADPCCAKNADISYDMTVPNLRFLLNIAGTRKLSGSSTVAYSTTCGACTTATFTVNGFRGCTIDGPLTALKGYKCSLYVSSIYQYTSSQEKRDGIPCAYTSDINTKINATHVRNCYTQYLGVGNAVYSLSGPKSTATVTCKELTAIPNACSTYSID